uniref:Putative secreted protein n=1 Tax=Amblyomma americanum TaxID=6943 RepID=A0A0C9SEM2_AMBAM
MRLVVLFAAVPLLVIKYSGVCGQKVTKHQLNDTKSGRCSFNGSDYPEGETNMKTDCGATYCDTEENSLTFVTCSDATPPPPCVLQQPKGSEYPDCCPNYIC